MAEQDAPRPVGDLFPIYYNELRDLAARRLSRERPNHTLRPTDLVHETYFVLSRSELLVAKDRAHFMGLAGRAMRQVLMQHARKRAAAKRGGNRLRVTLDEATAFIDGGSLDFLALDQAIARLEAEDPRAAEVVQHRFFAGLNDAEIGSVMGYSERWVRQQWAYAVLWLRRELDPGVGPQRRRKKS